MKELKDPCSTFCSLYLVYNMLDKLTDNSSSVSLLSFLRAVSCRGCIVDCGGMFCLAVSEWEVGILNNVLSSTISPQDHGNVVE